MEVFTKFMAEVAVEKKTFDFHLKCSKFQITHLCFADDVLLFSAATLSSAQTINEVLSEFASLSGPHKKFLRCEGERKSI